MGFTIDIDTGGTFTDGFFVLDGREASVKTPTTPHDLTVCFLKCIEAGADRLGTTVEDLLYQTEVIRFSNTIGTNTIIERTGSKVGLLLTSGLEDLAPVANGNGKASLVRPEMVLGIPESMNEAGEVVQTPEPGDVLAKAQSLIDRGARCLVVALAHADCNPGNEREVRRCIKQLYPRDFLGSIPVFLSSDISRRAGYAERINTAVLNAYIHAKLVRLLYKAGEDLRQRHYGRNLFIVHNNGAVARTAKTRAINTYNSGPAAGLLGARLIGDLYGEADLISADMGGTSFDLGFVRRGRPSFSLKPDVEGFGVNLPMLAIRAIGAGGGSIASVNGASVNGNKLKVGPASAGALPGPACFGLGGAEPTVTDADLVLGLLDPNYFLGGEMKLSVDNARRVIEEKIAGPLGVSLEEAALAVKTDIDLSMSRELRRLKDEMGPDFNPILVVYGGAGPAHCCDIARLAGLKKIVLTPYSAVFSAFSSLSMDVGHVYYRRIGRLMNDDGLSETIQTAIVDMKKEALRDMRGEGFSPDRIEYKLELLVQPAGEGPEVKVLAGPDITEDQTKLSAVAADAGAELSAAGWNGEGDLRLNSLSLIARAPMPHYGFKKVSPAPGSAGDAVKGERRVFLGEGRGAVDVAVYDGGRLGSGHELIGPALVDSRHTTIYAPPGWRLKVDEYQNFVLEEVPS